MTDIIVNASTSLVNINTSNITLGSNAVVLLSSVNAPGAIVTIRDYAGFASTNRKIIISTTSDTQFLDGPQISSFEIVTPYGYFTVSPRDTTYWTVLNSFAFGTQPNASVSSLVVTGQITADRIFNTSTFSTSHVQTSTATATSLISTPFVNASTMQANQFITSNVVSSAFTQISSGNVTGRLDANLISSATLNTSSLFVNGVNVYLATSTNLITNQLTVSSIGPSTAGQAISFTTTATFPCTVTSTLVVSTIIPQTAGRTITIPTTVQALTLLASTMGIGTASPDYILQIIGSSINYSANEFNRHSFVVGTGQATGAQQLIFGNFSTSTGLSSYSYIQSVSYNVITNPLYLNARGGNIILGVAGCNVGINTSTPRTILDIRQPSGTGALSIQNNSVSGNVAIDFYTHLSSYVGSIGYGNTGSSSGSVFQDKMWIYHNAKDFVFIGSGTAERMRVTSAGLVGIGTSTPSYTLDVAGTIQGSNIFYLYNSTTSTVIGLNAGYGLYGTIEVFNQGNTVKKNLSLQPFGCNVGVGTTSPSYRLDVLGNTQIQKFGASASNSYGTVDSLVLNTSLSVYSSSFASFLLTTASGGAPLARIIGFDDSGSAGLGGPYRGDLIFQTGFNTYLNEGMRIKSSGYVGIGTTTPSNALHVIQASGTAAMALQNNSVSGNPAIEFFNQASNSVGAIGYGNASSSSGSAFQDKFWIYHGSKDFVFIGSGATEKIRVTSSGAIGIGTTPSYPLHITATSNLFIGTKWFYGAGGPTNYVANATYGIAAYFNNQIVATEFIAWSDERLKTNIQDISYDESLSLLTQIQPKKYEWIDKLSNKYGTQYGFIAQDVKKILPQAILETPDFVPNLYTIAHISTSQNSTLLVFQSSFTQTNDIQASSFIQIHTQNTKYDDQIVSIASSNILHISTPIDNQEVFVYGTKVNDHMKLDKDILFSLTTAVVIPMASTIQGLQDRLLEIEKKLQ